MNGFRYIAALGGLAVAIQFSGTRLCAENADGADPLYDISTQAGGVAWVDSDLVTVNLAGFARYTLRSEPAGRVNESAVVTPATVVVTPDLAANPDFGYWTLDGERQADAWGAGFSQLRFTVETEDREAVAYLFVGDTDGDGVPDAYEQRFYGTLVNDADSDSDADGITLFAEYTGGTSPIFGNRTQVGGVVWADSSLVTINFEGLARYTLRSEPTGTVHQSAVVIPGTVVQTPDLVAQTGFGYWTLDGERQADAWGAAFTQLSFAVDSVDREAVAYLFSGDVDEDGVPDAYEQRFYGTLLNDRDSDSDADGITLLTEYTNGTHPLLANRTQAGGVVWADSALVNVSLQPEIAVEQPSGNGLIDGGSQNFGSVSVGNSISLNFIVRNLGGIDLTDLILTTEGVNASEFAVTASPTSPVGFSGSTTFTVRFSPNSVGARTAFLHLASNDPDENPFDLNLTGWGAASYASWQQDHFTLEEIADDTVSGPHVVLTVDGLSNLMKYALGVEPAKVVSFGLPEVTVTSTDWIYTYTRPSDRTDITYAVEFSTQLSEWSEAGVIHEKVSSESGIETWRSRYPLTSAANIFFRLKVRRP